MLTLRTLQSYSAYAALSLCLIAAAGCRSYPGGPVLPKPVEGQVDVGYGTRDRRDVNAAVSGADSDKLMATSPRTVSDMLIGRFAGVEVKQLPNGGTSIRIRGSRSLKGNQEPLVVLDGIPQRNGSSSLSDLAPQDIKSIEVLKDAGGSSVYGSRGANGVILIATKRGQ